MNKYHKTIDRLTIISSADEKGEALNYWFDNGYRIIRSGPKQVNISKVDPSKFHIVAEKEKR